MAIETNWLELVSKGLEVIAAPLVGYMFGKARTEGRNQQKLNAGLKEILELRKVQENHTSTLTEHTALHKGYVERDKRLEEKLDRTIEKLDGTVEKLQFIRGSLHSKNLE